MSAVYRVVGGLLMLNGASHVSQLFVLGANPLLMVAALFGLIYLLIGLGMLRGWRGAPGAAIAFCSIGLVMGTARMLHVELTAYGILHQLIHLIVVPASIYLMIKGRRAIPATDQIAK